jgi:L-fucose isomerase
MYAARADYSIGGTRIMDTIISGNRLQGSLPKIGIRPTIDGRRKGVRESLEKQTMDMAKSAAQLLTENLRHSSGEKVECVIADTCIGGIAESAAAAEKFARENVGATLTVTRSWCYGSETMDMNSMYPKAVWGFNGTERPGAVYLAACLAGHTQKGIPAFGIYGKDVQEASDTSIPQDVQEKLLQFGKSAIAVATMRGKSYLGMGGVSMGIAGSIVNPDFLESYLGMSYEGIDTSEFVRRIDEGIYDKDEYDRALAWVKKMCIEGTDYNKTPFSKEKKEKDWEFIVKMVMIGRDLMIGNPVLDTLGFGEEALGHNAIAAGFQGQRQWTDHFPNGDFLETMLNTSFDWNGMRQPFIVATENDHLNGIAMLFGNLLTNTAQIFSDVRTYWSPDSVQRVTGTELSGDAAHGIIHLINSGATCIDGTGRQTKNGKPAIKPFWEITPEEAENCLKATRFCPAEYEYFRGGGFSTTFETKGGMPLTMSRVNWVKGLGPVLQIAEGLSVDLPDSISSKIINRTNPSWPTTWFAPRLTNSGAFKDVYSVMNSWGANHGAISFGHIGADLITLASMLRIPVYMHNVPEERIFRPSAWNSFGTNDSEGADFRACANYGPMYGLK